MSQNADLVRRFTLLPESTNISISGILDVRETLTAERVSQHLQRPLYSVRATIVLSPTLLSNFSYLYQIIEP